MISIHLSSLKIEHKSVLIVDRRNKGRDLIAVRKSTSQAIVTSRGCEGGEGSRRGSAPSAVTESDLCPI